VPLLLFAVLALAPPPARADAANDAFQAAKALFTAGSYDEAIAAFTKAQSDYPTLAADCQRMIGCCYQWKKDYPKAVEAYGKLLADYPGTQAAAEAYYWIGLCREAQGNVDEAIAAFQKQIAQFPNSRKTAPAMLKLGERCQEKKQYDLAIEQFNKVLATSPDNTARAQLLIGICYQAQGKYEQAIAALDKVIESASGNGSADEARGRKAGCLTQIGIAYQAQERYDEAIASFNKAIECGNGNGSANEARLRIDECLRGQGKYAEELAYLQKLYDEKPDLRAHALIRQSEVLNEGLKDPNKCIETLKRLIAEMPADPLAKDAQTRIACVTLYDLKRPEEARALFVAFIAANPTFDNLVEVKYHLAGCDYVQKNWSAALAGYRVAYASNPTGTWPPTLKFMIGDCLAKMGNIQEARTTFTELVSLYPEHVDWVQGAQDYLLSLPAK
jgi:TolA-binding protein